MDNEAVKEWQSARNNQPSSSLPGHTLEIQGRQVSSTGKIEENRTKIELMVDNLPVVDEPTADQLVMNDLLRQLKR